MQGSPAREHGGGYTVLLVPTGGTGEVRQVEVTARHLRRLRQVAVVGAGLFTLLMLLLGIFTARVVTYGSVMEENLALRTRMATLDRATAQLEDAIRRIRLYDTQIRSLSDDADLPGFGPLDGEDAAAWEAVTGLDPEDGTRPYYPGEAGDPMEELPTDEVAPGDVRPAELWAMALEARTARLVGLVQQMEPRMSAMVQDLEDWRSYRSAFPSVWPARGRLSSGFGYRRSPFSRRWKFHTGLDIGAPRGSPIYAVSPGVVVYSGYNQGYGRMIEVDHGHGIHSRYAHNTSHFVAPGDLVEAGQIIATIGSTGRTTGPHLHFEMKIDGEFVDPLDYLP